MSMRNIRLDLEYDGRNYCGWQWQPQVPTIEYEVKKAVEKSIGHEVTIYTIGRTDAGVHAEQHPVHFFSPTIRKPSELLGGLNAMLPDDIVVYRVFDVPLEWRARKDAREREYRYTFFNDFIHSALWRHRSYWVKSELNIPAMQKAASMLVGRHDFSVSQSSL